MVSSFEFLYVFTEVHIGFLGFSALISVMSKASWRKSEVTLRFWTILALGLISIILSLGPVLLSILLVEERILWQMCCLAGFLGWVLHMMIFTTRFMKLYKADDMKLVSNVINLLYQIPFGISLITFAIGCFQTDKAIHFFFSGLFFFTLAAVGNFICFLVANSNATVHADEHKTG